jgi:hypothetical protein
MAAPAGLVWVFVLLLIITTLRLLPFINLDLALRLQLWLMDLKTRIERKLDEIERDDD